MKTPNDSFFESQRVPSDEEISQAVKNDRTSLVPPKEAKINIMKAINFKVAKPAFPGYYMLKRYGIPAAAGLALFIASYFGTDFAGSNNIADSQETKSAKISLSSAPHKHNKNTQPTPIVSSVEDRSTNKQNFANNINKSASFGSQNIFDTKSSVIDTKLTEDIATNSPIIDTKSTEDIATNSPIIEPESISDKTSKNIYPLSEYQIRNFSQPLNMQLERSAEDYGFVTPKYRKSGESTKFSLSLRGMAADNFSAGSSFDQSLDNSFAAGIYTPMSKSSDFEIGIEVGNEDFSKKYFDKFDAGKILYTNSQSSFWGALALRYTFDDANLLGLRFRPFAAVMFGASEIGPMGRFNAGFSKQITASTQAFLAFEGATSMYNNKYTWFGSNKLGITFGLNYSL